MEYKWAVLTVTTVGILMAGIDARIVLVGLPSVATALGADAEQAVWFTQAYLLGSTAILLLAGRITDLFGRVRVYTGGFIVFTVGSALASISQNPLEVIVFRAIQGIGSGILITNSVVMIVDATPEDELGFALGLNQIAFRFGAMAGLTLSGVIISFLDWRALFYVNVPIGVFGTLWARRQTQRALGARKENWVRLVRLCSVHGLGDLFSFGRDVCCLRYCSGVTRVRAHYHECCNSSRVRLS